MTLENNSCEEIEKFALDVRKRIQNHLKDIGLNTITSENGAEPSKPQIRLLHEHQREARAQQEQKFFNTHGRKLLNQWFADGSDIEVKQIRPKLIPVESGTREGNVFRFATLLWSVPVSRGFGRRMRFIVIDQNNYKLMGLFALGDPVFNLNVRDEWIGWDVEDRKERLVNVMDAYVLGAVPPYSQLIGGKLIGSLVGSAEVNDIFEEKYGNKEGIISGKVKNARLALVTTSSALGRSSLYNRLKIPGAFEYEKIGETEGYGHFHIPESAFEDLRQILACEDHKYANGNRYGQGPNWKFRVVRAGLQRVGLDPEMLKHGIKREVYAIALASNCKDYLLGRAEEAEINLPNVYQLSKFCLDRWMIPRAGRRQEYSEWRKEDTWKQILQYSGLENALDD